MLNFTKMENVTGDVDSIFNTTKLCISDFQLENDSDFSGELAVNESVTIDDTIDFVFNGVGLLILLVVGVSANILSAIVLSHPRLKSSLTTLLLGLTISDTVVISTSFLIFSFDQIIQHIHIFSWYNDIGTHIFLPWLLPIALTAQMSSVYFTVVITLERYIAVCLPLQARSLCTQSSAKWSSSAVILFSVLYNIPRWFEFKAVPKTVNCTTGQVTAYRSVETDFRKNDWFISYYINWSYLVFMYIIPFTILLYFNAAIYQKTRIHRTVRNALSPSRTNHGMSEDIQLASMLFGIVITFIACNMLSVAINLLESFGQDDMIGDLIPISNFLIVFCCSTNFIFYCVFGTEFRRRLSITLRLSVSRSSMQSEMWSERDSIRRRQSRLDSLQIPSIGGRSRSNSNCSSGNNNGSTKHAGESRPNTVRKSSDSCAATGQQNWISIPEVTEDQRNIHQSTATIVTIVSDEV